MKHVTLFTLLTMAVLALNSCKKDPTANQVLPAITQEGKNTAGFTLNDEVWVPYAECHLNDACRKISASYGLPNTTKYGLSFQFERIREKTGKSSLTIATGLRGNITSLGEKIDSIGVTFIGENSIGNTDYYIGPLSGSKFIITKLDTINKIISGEFEFILRESNSDKQIILKNGRFDFKINACLWD
nr:hypothetical protein [Pedobacter glucosidilyticus]